MISTVNLVYFQENIIWQNASPNLEEILLKIARKSFKYSLNQSLCPYKMRKEQKLIKNNIKFNTENTVWKGRKGFKGTKS